MDKTYPDYIRRQPVEIPLNAIVAGIQAAAQYANSNGDIPRESVAEAIVDALRAAIRYIPE